MVLRTFMPSAICGRRRQWLIISTALVASLSSGLGVGMGRAWATEETNSCTGTPASPAVLPSSGSYSESSWSSSTVRWTQTPCLSCDVSEDEAQEHETHVKLTTTHLPNCPGSPDHYVATITVYFCSAMGSGSALDILGTATFHQGNFEYYADLQRLNDWSATASIACPTMSSYPDQIDIRWGVNPIDDSDTAAKGKAFKGFDVLVSCCTL